MRTGLFLHQLQPIGLKTHGRRAKSLFRLGFDHLRHLVLNPLNPNQDNFSSEKHLSAASKLSAIKKEIEEKIITLTTDEDLTAFIEHVRVRWTGVTDEYPQISDRIWKTYCRKHMEGNFFDFEAVKAVHQIPDQ